MVVSARQFARFHHLGKNTVYRWIAWGLIEHQVKECPERRRYFLRLDAEQPRLHPGPVPDPETLLIKQLCTVARSHYHAAKAKAAMMDQS